MKRKRAQRRQPKQQHDYDNIKRKKMNGGSTNEHTKKSEVYGWNTTSGENGKRKHIYIYTPPHKAEFPRCKNFCVSSPLHTIFPSGREIEWRGWLIPFCSN